MIMICMFIFFFFKQKTAYEMRISDWSSDVCSSDLHVHICRRGSLCGLIRDCGEGKPMRICRPHRPLTFGWLFDGLTCAGRQRQADSESKQLAHIRSLKLWRSEEHTSELQSLMRISYAVFCLKKKQQIQHSTT